MKKKRKRMSNVNNVLIDKLIELLESFSEDNAEEITAEYYADGSEYFILRYFNGKNTEVWEITEEGYENIGVDY